MRTLVGLILLFGGLVAMLIPALIGAHPVVNGATFLGAIAIIVGAVLCVIEVRS